MQVSSYLRCSGPFFFSAQIVIYSNKVKAALAVEIIKYRSLCAHMGEDAITPTLPVGRGIISTLDPVRPFWLCLVRG